MRPCTTWPLPAPEVVRETLRAPLSGLWIDHVPTGAELAARSLLYTAKLEEALEDPLATGDWTNSNRPCGPHPERHGPQMVMPDAWFDHEGGRRPPPPDVTLEPGKGQQPYSAQSGYAVSHVISSAMCGSADKEAARELPALWRRGLLESRAERALANQLLRNTSASSWYRMMLDEEWTPRRAAEVLREACIEKGELCALMNRWAKAPAGTPEPGSRPPETPAEIAARCRSQITDRGPSPLGRTVEIAQRRGYKRVE